MSGNRQKSRNYYTEVTENLPKDTVILTAGCAKYRYNKLALGDIDGIPRVLDAGQCSDSYSLAVIALRLKEVCGLEDINGLPVSYDIAWYEQKAVAGLLALLFLGVKGIRLRPTLAAFLSPDIGKIFKSLEGCTCPMDISGFLYLRLMSIWRYCWAVFPVAVGCKLAIKVDLRISSGL
jgi:hydroxylamine reductase